MGPFRILYALPHAHQRATCGWNFLRSTTIEFFRQGFVIIALQPRCILAGSADSNRTSCIDLFRGIFTFEHDNSCAGEEVAVIATIEAVGLALF